MGNPTYEPMLKKQMASKLLHWEAGTCESRGYDTDMHHITMQIMGGLTLSIWSK